MMLPELCDTIFIFGETIVSDMNRFPKYPSRMNIHQPSNFMEYNS